MGYSFTFAGLNLIALGEYEKTISQSFMKAANLRALVSKSNAPEVIRHCQPIFSKLVNPQVRNTLVTNMLSLSFTEENDDSEANNQTLYDENSKIAKLLPTDLHQCIEQSFAQSPSRAPLLSHLTINGLTYSVSSKHHGNSCIMLDAGPNRNLFPARLDYIVELRIDDDILTLIAVRRYQPFPRRDDPFTRFPSLQTQLWMAELESLELYTIDKIRSHFTLSSLVYKGKDVIIAVSLYRVSSSIFFDEFELIYHWQGVGHLILYIVLVYVPSVFEMHTRNCSKIF